MVADDPGWTDFIAEALFGEGFKDVEKWGTQAVPGAVLLAHLAVDPHSGFSAAMRAQAIKRCWGIEFAAQARSHDDRWLYEPAVAQALLGALPADLPAVWDGFQSSGAATMKGLSLRRTSISDLRPLAKLTALQWLALGETQVSDLAPLAGLTALQWLDLGGIEVSDLTPLARLTVLEWLNLGLTPVSDLNPLPDLKALRWLHLSGTRVDDITRLAGLARLEHICVQETQVSEAEVRRFQEARKAAGLCEVEIYR